MERIIAQTILQAYHSLEKIAKQIDELVYARAVSTHSLKVDCVFSTAEKQVEKIVKLMEKKNSLIDLKLLVDEHTFSFRQRQKQKGA